MGVPGEDTPGVFHMLDFLRWVNSGERVELGARVAVIGAGNAAIDSARTALRLGAKQVSIVYRRSRAEVPAMPSEVEEAEREGVSFQYLTVPVRPHFYSRSAGPDLISRSGKSERGFVVVPDNRPLAP